MEKNRVDSIDRLFTLTGLISIWYMYNTYSCAYAYNMVSVDYKEGVAHNENKRVSLK